MSEENRIKAKIRERLKNAPKFYYTCIWCQKPAGCGTRPMEIIHFNCWREYQYFKSRQKLQSPLKPT